MARAKSRTSRVRDQRKPRCVVIAGPNGAGKTTFARTYLTQDTAIVHFINADLIASGLSPLRPQLAAVAAGRLVLAEIERLASSAADFAFESTLSGSTYLRRFEALKGRGYRLEIVYLQLASSDLAFDRVAALSPEAQVLDAERRRRILDAVNALRPDDRLVIGARYFLDPSGHGMEVLTVPYGGWPD